MLTVHLLSTKQQSETLCDTLVNKAKHLAVKEKKIAQTTHKTKKFGFINLQGTSDTLSFLTPAKWDTWNEFQFWELFYQLPWEPSMSYIKYKEPLLYT